MKNKEKYAKEIVEIICNCKNIAVYKKTERPVICSGFDCDKCIFCANDNCRRKYLLKKWAESEYIEKSVISKRDSVILDYFKSNLKYIARNEDGKLFAYEAQPRKGKTYWKCTCGNCLLLNRQLNIDFPMVKWEDEEPWLIEDLKRLEVCEEYD